MLTTLYMYIGIGFLLRGHLHGNNSIVNINDIGESSRALLCLTNNIMCCRPSHALYRDLVFTWHWYFPNGSAIQFGSPQFNFYDFYRNRGFSVVRLHRRNYVTMPAPTGMFRCVIPDANGTNQNVYVGIYTEGNGET